MAKATTEMKSAKFGYKEMAEAQAKAQLNSTMKLPKEEAEDARTKSKKPGDGKIKYAVVCEAQILGEDGAHEIRYVQFVDDPDTDITHVMSPGLVTSTVSITEIGDEAAAKRFLESLTPEFVVTVPL